jgi:hypothetical protein
MREQEASCGDVARCSTKRLKRRTEYYTLFRDDRRGAASFVFGVCVALES